MEIVWSSETSKKHDLEFGQKHQSVFWILCRVQDRQGFAKVGVLVPGILGTTGTFLGFWPLFIRGVPKHGGPRPHRCRHHCPVVADRHSTADLHVRHPQVHPTARHQRQPDERGVVDFDVPKDGNGNVPVKWHGQHPSPRRNAANGAVFRGKKVDRHPTQRPINTSDIPLPSSELVDRVNGRVGVRLLRPRGARLPASTVLGQRDRHRPNRRSGDFWVAQITAGFQM
uniref:Uncharacterized protein n=1 Tax=Panagrolaimus sp. JU765 TaxID=591449 RepID=A0AC34QYM1_9BILA